MDAPKRIWAARGLCTVEKDSRWPEPDEYILAAEHERLMAEKDAEIGRLKRERQRVDRRIASQRAHLRWWQKVFQEHVSAACRRRIYHPFSKWYPVLARKSTTIRAQKDYPASP